MSSLTVLGSDVELKEVFINSGLIPVAQFL
jgi:hypothetical protein